MVWVMWVEVVVVWYVFDRRCTMVQMMGWFGLCGWWVWCMIVSRCDGTDDGANDGTPDPTID